MIISQVKKQLFMQLFFIMHYINKIEFLQNQKKVTQQELADGINITRSGLQKMLQSADMKVSTLQAIADFFKVPITYFFEENSSSTEQKDKIVSLPFNGNILFILVRIKHFILRMK